MYQQKSIVATNITKLQLKTNRFLSRLGPLLRVVLSAYLSCESKWIHFSVGYFITEVTKLVNSRGVEFTVKYVKTSRNCVFRKLGGQPLGSVDGVSLNSEGIPKWLSPIVDLSSTDRIRVLTTLLTSLRAITLTPKLDVKTITDPWKGKDNVTQHELWNVIRSIGSVKRINKLKDWEDFHLSTKRGPAGQAILTSISEVTLLTPQLIDDISLLGGNKLASQLIALTDRLDILNWRSISWFWRSTYKLKNECLRKLSFFSDKEGKTRVIGIVDYWTQSALRPLHGYLNNILKGIKSDMTFNQNSFTENPLDVGANKFHSIDLSAATDRMPILLQKRILRLYIGSKRSEAWHRLLTSIPFKVTPGKYLEPYFVKYEAGQPMGAYSSWPAMALTHHFLVRIAAQRCGMTSDFSNYYILGDDLVIGHDGVAEAYKLLISDLDMPYSPEKTHTSKDLFEFAKRWFYKGSEITGFSISGLMSVYKRYPLLHNFLSNQQSHGWVLPIERHPGLIRDIFSSLTKRVIINKLESSIKLYLIFDSLISWKHGNKSQEVYDTFFERISAIAPAYTFRESFPTPQSCFKTLLLNCKYMMIEADLYKFQTDAYKVNNTLNGLVDTYIGSGQPTWNSSFIRETLSVMLNWNNPIVCTLNRMIDRSVEFLCSTVLSTPDELLPSLVIEQGLSKYFVSHGVFSMRSSHSIALAESAVVKMMIKYLSNYNKLTDKSVAYLVKDPRSLLSNANPELKYMESSMIPSALFRRIAPYLIKAPLTRFLVRGLIKRVFFLSGSTFIIGLITYMKGLPAVVLFTMTCWTALQALFGVIPSWSVGDQVYSFASVLGNILLHTIEVYLGLLFVACCYHHQVAYEIMVHYWDLYYHQGVITLIDLIVSYYGASHAFLMQISENVLPVSHHIINQVGSSGIIQQGFALLCGSWLLIAFIRWFLGF